MKLASAAFENGGYMPARYSKLGGNVSPNLEFIDVKANVKSLVIICHDPDSISDFVHWLVWNINPNVTTIKEGSLPTYAIQGINDWNAHNWGGPQPPSGVHRYIFDLYALDAILNLSSDSTRKDLEGVMNGHVIDTATMSGLYSA